MTRPSLDRRRAIAVSNPRHHNDGMKRTLAALALVALAGSAIAETTRPDTIETILTLQELELQPVRTDCGKTFVTFTGRRPCGAPKPRGRLMGGTPL